MTVTEFLSGVNYAIRGIDDAAPSVGTEEADYWIATLNRKKDELYKDSKVLFDESFLTTSPNEEGTVATNGDTTLSGTGTFFTDYKAGDTILVSGETVRTIDTITSDTALTVTSAFSTTSSGLTFTRASIIASGVTDYSLNRAFLSPANRAYVLTTDNKKVYIDYLKPRESITSTQMAYIHGVNPKTISFTSTIDATDDIVGGTLYTPGYYLPADVDGSAGTNLLNLPDNQWGVLATAAEIAFGDIIYEDKAEGLNAKANNLYMHMVRNNRRNTYDQTRRIAYGNQRIRGTEIN